MAPTDEEIEASVASTLKYRVDTDQLTADHYVFVPKKHLLDSTLTQGILDSEQSKEAFADSSQSDHFYMDRARRWFNRGVSVQDITSKIKMAESTPQKGVKHQIPTHPNQRQAGSNGYVAGYQQIGVGTRVPGQGAGGGSHSAPNPGLGQQGMARQVPTATSNTHMEALVRAEQAPTVANFNRVQTLPVRPKYSR